MILDQSKISIQRIFLMFVAIIKGNPTKVVARKKARKLGSGKDARLADSSDNHPYLTV